MLGSFDEISRLSGVVTKGDKGSELSITYTNQHNEEFTSKKIAVKMFNERELENLRISLPDEYRKLKDKYSKIYQRFWSSSWCILH